MFHQGRRKDGIAILTAVTTVDPTTRFSSYCMGLFSIIRDPNTLPYLVYTTPVEKKERKRKRRKGRRERKSP